MEGILVGKKGGSLTTVSSTIPKNDNVWRRVDFSSQKAVIVGKYIWNCEKISFIKEASSRILDVGNNSSFRLRLQLADFKKNFQLSDWCQIW